MPGPSDVHEAVCTAEVRHFSISDRHDVAVEAALDRNFTTCDEQSVCSVSRHHAVQQPDGLRDHAGVQIVIHSDGGAQLLAGVRIEQRMPPLSDCQLSQRTVVETILVLVSSTEQSK